MCGIAGGIGDAREEALTLLAHRGPDAAGIVQVGPFWLAHTRLAIQDLDSRSNQPFERGGIHLVYNGELWNRDDLRDDLEAEGEEFFTTGDTEVVAAALDLWGLDALPRFRGMFVVAWTDGEKLWIARDRFGEVPCHLRPANPFVFASELKALCGLTKKKGGTWLGPGEALEVTAKTKPKRITWYRPDVVRESGSPADSVRSHLENGVRDRLIADVPVCTLLSGGVDSSAIAAILSATFPDLVAYTAVMDPKGSDLKNARLVAEYLEIELREVAVPQPTADDLAETVRVIEQPHKAQVEIAWACLALARAIEADGFKVTYSGEGSDELWASYGFAYHGIKKHGYLGFRRRLIHDQHRKNFARANKVFMRHGVECRLPFLDTGLVECALGLRKSEVSSKRSDKAVLQEAVTDLLPKKIVDRPKVAFQDGCGLKKVCASAVSNPVRYYNAEFKKAFGRSG